MRELTIDWTGLHSAFQMNMPEVRCFLSLEDGHVLKLPPGDPGLATVRANPNQFASVEAIPSRIQYQWLFDFIKAVEDESVRVRLEASVNGKGAFRRFKDILLTLPDERRRWFEYRDLMMRLRIVEWIRELGIQPQNPPPWNEEGHLTDTSLISSAAHHEVEELRDFLIDWAENRTHTTPPSPTELEQLATAIAAKFHIRSPI